MPTAVDTETAQETIGIIEQAVKDFSWQTAAVLVCLLVACVVVIRIVVTLADRAMTQAKLDRGVRTFLRSGLKVVLWLVAVCALLGYLGVPMTSLVALLSVLGLAVSLAIQGTLSNLAGGIMLLSAHPFSAGDFVEAGGVSGTVQEVGLVYTKLDTIDNKVVYIPNGEISGKTITNYSGNDKRRVELKVTASYNDAPEKVKKAMAGVVESHPLVLPDPEPMIRVSGYASSSIEYILRVWCATGDYWTVYFDLTEQIKTAFDAAGIEMTYDHLNVHIIGDAAQAKDERR
ncbi:MAG: mechanosensitive ion channel family protein [Oscillospiraceae bacterium]|nr:mechanosensitive ion channel family protein [Oscillospiraceae bacterium]